MGEMNMEQYIMPEPYLKHLTDPSMGINQDKSLPKISEPLAFQYMIQEDG